MAIDKSLVSGSMAMMILKLLSEKDMYGYEMIDTLRKRSENVFELKAGTLYPLLHGLEDKQYLLATGQIDDAHTVPIAAAEAQLSVDLLVQLRNKAVEAYNELMRISL